VFGMLAFVQLPPGDNDRALAITVTTIVLSVVVHGLSTGLIIRRYAQTARGS